MTDMTRSRPSHLFTIGYEKTTQPAVLDELARAKVNVVIDTRAVAASRRPGFSKRQLAAGLDQRGVGYVHLRDLGTPKDGRLAARTGRLDDLFRIYERHLATPPAQQQLDELTSLARTGRRLCLLCYEREPSHCHRRRIAEVVGERLKIDIEHLFCASI